MPAPRISSDGGPLRDLSYIPLVFFFIPSHLPSPLGKDAALGVHCDQGLVVCFEIVTSVAETRQSEILCWGTL